MLSLVVFFFLAAVPSALAEDRLFLCQDGTYTNIEERLCQPYEPKGSVVIAPAGATFASIRTLLPEASPHTRAVPDPLPVCHLYKEWMMLNLRTGGGVTFRDTDDVPRWLALSRIFTAIGAPYCE